MNLVMIPALMSRQLSNNHKPTKKVTIEHEYMKCQSIDTLIEAYNKDGQRPKLKQKVND